MKKLALIIILMIPVFCWSQSTNRMATPSNWERLNVDFEIKNNSSPEPHLIQQINLDQYESQVQENTDVEVIDHASGYTIILYSRSKSKKNKSVPENNQTDQ